MDTFSDCALLLSARRARASAARFAAIVDRFGAEMPGHIDRLHEAFAEIRHVADALEHGGVPHTAAPVVAPPVRPRLAAE